LVKELPRLAVMMLIGMAGMFLAPFGMLISKWAVLKAVVDAFAPLSVFIVFGSAATLFFWVKWMGKLLEVAGPGQEVDRSLALGESVTLWGLAAGTFLACLLFPWVSSVLIEPYVRQVYGHSGSMAQGNLTLMTLMMIMIMLFPLSYLHYGRGVRVVDAYLGGANVRGRVGFRGAAGQEHSLVLGNYYLRGFVNESWLARSGVIGGAIVLGVMLATAAL
jgi:ech hydrogenase subunit A